MENIEDKLNLEGCDPPFVGMWVVNPNKCTRCGECVYACELSLLYLTDECAMIKQQNLCTHCGDCVDACGYRAIKLT